MAENDAPAPIKGIAALAQRKVFGVPIVFLFLIAAAALLYYAIRLPKGEDAEEALDDAGEPGAEDFGGDVSNASPGTPIFIAHPPPDISGNDDDDEPVEKTDEEWRTEAIGYLIKEGNSVAASTSAITDYLNKKPLSMTQRALVDKAIAKLGPPPSGYVDNPEQGGGAPPPAVKQGNPPTRHTIRGRNDDTPQELTRLYYKREDPATIRYLVAANHELAANAWRKGVVIKIPMYKPPKYIRSTAILDTPAEIARKNGTTAAHIKALNPTLTFPVPVGTRVRVQ